MSGKVHLEAAARRYLGVAERYDLSRPAPPRVLFELLARLAGARPRLVVDLGSGTGLSSRPWAAHAGRVIGMEPNPDMRARAEEVTRERNVRFVPRPAHDTGLGAGSADIVFVMQALHWMEPRATWSEVARILRPGGVVASVHALLPPLVHPALHEPARRVEAAAERYRARHRLDPEERSWQREPHLRAMGRTGEFGWWQEIGLHDLDEGDAERFVNLAISRGDTWKALRHGATERALHIDALRAAARRVLGARRVPWLWSYAALLAVRR